MHIAGYFSNDIIAQIAEIPANIVLRINVQERAFVMFQGLHLENRYEMAAG